MDSTSEKQTVGYGQPPKEHRFRKGVSGNPAGRPKRAPGLGEAIERELNRTITIVVDGRRESSTKQQAIARQLTNASLKGDTRSVRVLLQVLALKRKAGTGAVEGQLPFDPYPHLTVEQKKARLAELLAKGGFVQRSTLPSNGFGEAPHLAANDKE